VVEGRSRLLSTFSRGSDEGISPGSILCSVHDPTEDEDAKKERDPCRRDMHGASLD
jgi:hypothetical protein